MEVFRSEKDSQTNVAPTYWLELILARLCKICHVDDALGRLFLHHDSIRNRDQSSSPLNLLLDLQPLYKKKLYTG